MTLYKLNHMATTVRQMESYLPVSWHSIGYSALFNHMVKLSGTAGIRVEKLTQRESTVYLKNRRSIQNHIGGLHACSMALAAESATGILIGMNVPDTHIPLIKSMHVDFVRRCVGGIRVEASFSTEDDYRRVHEEDRGEVSVQVRVVDESGNEPIKAQMIWAWVAKDRSKKG
jgi:acyl-coenzyme A thioesterase PaaI-like protein